MDIFSTHAMMGVVNTLIRPRTFLLDMAFKSVVQETTQEVHVDIEIGNRRALPFVSPESKGTNVDVAGYETDTFVPAYLKPRSILKPGSSIVRAIGERIGGGALTPQERQAQGLVKILHEHANRITRVMEGMAASALIYGSVTVSGQDYAPRVVSFRRDPSLTIINAGDYIWGTGAKATPMLDIENAALQAAEVEGTNITDVITDIASWRVLREDPYFKDIINLRRATGNNTADIGPVGLSDSGAKLVAETGDFRIWVYLEWTSVQAPDGSWSTKPLLPTGTVIGVNGAQLQGTRLFGAILDEEAIEAGLCASEIFPKSFPDKEAGTRVIVSQSAPLVVPKRSNASFCIRPFGNI